MSNTLLEVSGIAFKTKKELKTKVRSILYKYNLNKAIDLDDFEFMYDLLSNHPEAEKKIGVGVDQILVVQQNEISRNRHFFIIRIDGTSDDFSLKKCIDNTKPFTKFSSVCRRIISNYEIAFKRSFFENNNNPHCPITGDSLSYFNSHVDHEKPLTFKCLVKQFIQEFDIDINAIEYSLKDNQIGYKLKDTNLETSFYDFHKRNAKLRVVTKKANLSILKK